LIYFNNGLIKSLNELLLTFYRFASSDESLYAALHFCDMNAITFKFYSL